MPVEDFHQAKSEDPFIAHQAQTALIYVRERRTDLQTTGFVLSKYAHRMSQYSSIATVAVIVLGAFVGTKAVMDRILGPASTLNVLIYAFTGLLIAVLSGLESTFKWNSKSAELRNIAAKCRRSEHAIDVGLRKIQKHDLKAATALLKQVDEELDAIECEASKIGVDLQKSLYPGGHHSDREKIEAIRDGRSVSTFLEHPDSTPGKGLPYFPDLQQIMDEGIEKSS